MRLKTQQNRTQYVQAEIHIPLLSSPILFFLHQLPRDSIAPHHHNNHLVIISRNPIPFMNFSHNSIRPLSLGGSHKSSKTHPWSIDGRFASVDEDVVKEAAECAAEERCYHWNLLE